MTGEEKLRDALVKLFVAAQNGLKSMNDLGGFMDLNLRADLTKATRDTEGVLKQDSRARIELESTEKNNGVSQRQTEG